MKNQFVRVAGLILVLGTLPAVLGAQKTKPGEPAGQANSCTGAGVWCLFGSAAGCTASCTPPLRPQCRGASCSFGFPVPSTCTCV